MKSKNWFSVSDAIGVCYYLANKTVELLEKMGVSNTMSSSGKVTPKRSYKKDRDSQIEVYSVRRRREK